MALSFGGGFEMANPVNGQSTQAAVAGVKGENTSGENGTNGGDGVTGISNAGNGVHGISVSAFGLLGESKSGRGVVGLSDTNYGIRAASRTSAGLRASSVEGRGVEGWATRDDGVWGISKDATGVHGVSEAAGTGVVGQSKTGRGVHGFSESGDSVFGKGRRGVVGESDSFQGVFGWSGGNAGVVGESVMFHAVFGISHDRNNAGVFGANDKGGWGVVGRSATNTGVSGESDTGVGVHGKGGRLAGFFEGDVEVTGDIRLANADCAEDFDIADADSVEPGTVMVLADEGALRQSHQPYDKRVAGVVSGAGTYKPGIVLDKQSARSDRKPIALLGKVYCKVDARYAAIEVGDLLTTSASPGHVMKASDPHKAYGAVIGKALRTLKEGQGLIPILIALQ
jgi:hypothetical protein